MIIYCATCCVTEKKYVGRTKQGLTKRWRSHQSCAKNGSNCFFHQAIRDYGANSFSIEVLKELSPSEDCVEWEAKFIHQFDTLHPCGYNAVCGAEISEATAAYMRSQMRRTAEEINAYRPA
jgi:Ackermannviridae homing endonuclease